MAICEYKGVGHPDTITITITITVCGVGSRAAGQPEASCSAGINSITVLHSDPVTANIPFNRFLRYVLAWLLPGLESLASVVRRFSWMTSTQA